MSKRLWQCLLVNSITSVAILWSLAATAAQTPISPQLLHADVINSEPISQATAICQLSEALTFSEETQLSGASAVLPADETNSLSAELDAASANVSTGDYLAATSSFASENKAVTDSIDPVQNSATSPLVLAEVPISPLSNHCPNLALSNANTFYSATALLGAELVAQAPPSEPLPPEPDFPLPEPEAPAEKPEFSRALNLLSLRSLKKPVGNKVLDTGVSIAGPRLRDTSESFWTRDFLTGNWGGARDDLYKHGVDVTLAQFSEVFGVTSGGRKQESAYNNISVISFDFDTEGLGLWKGGQVHLTTSWLDGTSVTRNFVGSLNTVYFGDPPRKGYRLFELWYGQKINDQIELRIGKIYPYVKIGIVQSANIFSNSSFQYPTFLGTTNAFGQSTAFAAAPFGIEVLYTPSPQWFVYGSFADGFDDPSGGFDNYRGLKIGLSADEGLESIIEAGYKLNQEKGSTGLPGTYRVGVQLHTGQFKDQFNDRNGNPFLISGLEPKIRTGNYSFYLIGEQMIYRESPDPTDRTQGLTGFFKTVWIPKEEVNLTTFHIGGGLSYEGLIPGRDRDVFGVGVTYTQLGEGFRKLLNNIRPPDVEVGGAETVVEIAYAAEIAPWWILIGSFQKILSPGGSNQYPDATVLGISSRFAL